MWNTTNKWKTKKKENKTMATKRINKKKLAEEATKVVAKTE